MFRKNSLLFCLLQADKCYFREMNHCKLYNIEQSLNGDPGIPAFNGEFIRMFRFFIQTKTHVPYYMHLFKNVFRKM